MSHMWRESVRKHTPEIYMFVCDFINLKADSISFGQILSGCIRCKKRQELISLMGQIF